MRRITRGVLLLSLLLGPASAAWAQSSGQIPVQSDLRREERIERKLDGRPANPEPNVTPDNPTGVAGFNGPPGTVGDSVGSFGALPQGVTGADIR